MKFSHFLGLILWLISTGCGLSYFDIKRREEYLYRAHVYYNNKKYPNALQQIEYALEIDPKCKRAIVSKGWSLYFLNRYEDSEEAFKKAHEVDDTDPWVNYGLGSIYFKKGLRVSVKLNNWEKEFAKNPEKREKFKETIEKNRAEMEMWLGDSLKYFQKAMEVSSETYDLHKMIGFVHVAKGIEEYPKSIESFDRFITLIDKEAEGIQELMKAKEKERLQPGIDQKKLESLDQAIESLKKQLKTNRRNYCVIQEFTGDLSYQLAYAELQKAQNAKSTQEAEESRKRMTEYADDVIERLKLASQYAPEIPSYYRNLARVAQLKGDHASASKYLKEYLERYPLDSPRDRSYAKIELELIQMQEEEKERQF